MIDDSQPQDNDMPPEKDIRFCPECGKKIKQPTKFCPFCGHPIRYPADETHAANIAADDTAPVDEQDRIAFVVNNAGYYLNEFRKFNVAGKDVFSVTWNRGAFLGGFGWMLYRKMYMWACIAFLLSFIPYLGLAAWIAIGAVANYLYYKHAKKKILEIRSLHPSGDVAVILSHLGGVNKWVIAAATVLTILALLLLVGLLLLFPFSFLNLFNLYGPPSKYI